MEELAIKSLETTKAIREIQKSIAESQVVPVQTATAVEQVKISRNSRKNKDSPKYKLSDSESSEETLPSRTGKQIDSKWLQEKAR